jgi:ribonucleotide monophosphatase NagD (HAD superfamily)
MNRIFQMLMEGATLVGMHRNLYWRTSEGLQLDSGAYISGLEEATGSRATICGKPTAPYFESALALLGLRAALTALVDDDVTNIEGARAVGMAGVLVRTGKFLRADLERGEPDHVIASIADLPSLLRAPAV